jgi:hypothetical protein
MDVLWRGFVLLFCLCTTPDETSLLMLLLRVLVC